MKIRKFTTRKPNIRVKIKADKLKKINLYFKKEQKVMNLKEDKGVRIMAVSMATIPVIRGAAAEEMLEALKHPTITKEFLEKWAEKTKNITITRVR